MGRVNRLLERRVLRRAADQALLTALTQRPDGAAQGQPGGAPDRDFEYTRFTPTGAGESYDREPVTAPIPVAEIQRAASEQPIDALPEPVDVYDLVPDQPEALVVEAPEPLPEEPDDFGWDDHVELPPNPVEARPLRARPLAAATLVHPAAEMPMPQYRPQPWYRTKQAVTVLAAAVTVAVVSGGWLLLGGPSTAVEKSHTEAPTSAPPTPSSVAPTAVNAAPPPAPPPPPPPPPTAEQVYSGPQRQYSEPWRSMPTEQEKPEVGVTRTPATRAPMSVAPVPRPVEGSDSNTPGDAPGEKPRRRGCFGFC